MCKYMPILVVLACVPWLADSNGRVHAQFSGALADGTTFKGLQIGDWNDSKAQPKLMEASAQGQPKQIALLFDTKNPVRWLLNESAGPVGPAQAFVEFFGGDRLPGRVTEYHFGNESPAQRLPAHLIVKPDTAFLPPGWPARPGLRIRARSVRRIIWEPRAGATYAPATVYFQDGRQMSYRSLYWNNNSVKLLLKEGGVQTIPLNAIAELHLPARNCWQVYYETLAAVNPECSSRMMRVETTSGLTATTSLERFFPVGEHQLIQPAWSIDPVWVLHKHVCWRRFFSPQEVPFFLLEPVRVEQRSSIRGAGSWQLDRNVKNRLLRGGKKIFGWGLGTHAYCALEFELPRAARAFRTRVGLDDEVLHGGCARGAVYLNRAEGKPLWQTPLLIGSSAVIDSGAVALGNATPERKSLVLVSDPAQADTPPGADPFNIRDMVNWLEPQLELDLPGLRAEVARLLPATIPAWQGWTVSSPKEAGLTISARLDATDASERSYQPEVGVARGPLVLRQHLPIAPKQKFLCLSVLRYPQTPALPPSWIEVRVDGKLAGQFAVPDRLAGSSPPQLVPLEKYQGRPAVLLEVDYYPSQARERIQWHGLEFVETPELAVTTAARPVPVSRPLNVLSPPPPQAHVLFEDQPAFPAQLNQGQGAAVLEAGDKHAGTHSVKITGARRGNPTVLGQLKIRRQPGPGEFRYLQFAWKKPDGQSIGLQLAHDGVFGPSVSPAKFQERLFLSISPVASRVNHPNTIVPALSALLEQSPSYRYHAGQRPKNYAASIPVNAQLPKGWTLVTRDLYADFGAFTLTGLSLDAEDGAGALFDHIRLGRFPSDLEP